MEEGEEAGAEMGAGAAAQAARQVVTRGATRLVDVDVSTLDRGERDGDVEEKG